MIYLKLQFCIKTLAIPSKNFEKWKKRKYKKSFVNRLPKKRDKMNQKSSVKDTNF